MKCSDYNASRSAALYSFAVFAGRRCVPSLNQIELPRFLILTVYRFHVAVSPVSSNDHSQYFATVIKSTIYNLRVSVFVPIINTINPSFVQHGVFLCPKYSSQSTPTSYKSSSLRTVSAVNIFSELLLAQNDDSTNTVCLSVVMSTNI